MIKRDTYPFKDKWCLPGGFVGYDEDIEDSANINNVITPLIKKGQPFL